ncbi:MAG TPA: hypothetical protein VF337_08070 [Candidatus Limnocylindrales bacterium]
MNVRRILACGLLACGLLALVVSACGSAGSTTGPTSAGASMGSSAPMSTGASATGTVSAGGGLVDPAGLTTLTHEKVCTLLTSDEAATILGKTIDGPATGMLIKNLGTNCLYTSVAAADGGTDLLKIEFNVSGYEKSGLDTPADPKAFVKAQLYVSLGDDPNSVALFVEAPTLDMAKKVAETVIPRIATLT